MNLEPIEYETIEVKHGTEMVCYPDCMETSVLRFLHILLKNEDNEGNMIVDLERLKLCLDMDLEQCKDVYEFFTKYNLIREYSLEYYYDEGLDERSEWCSLLHFRPGFNYVHDQYEIKATMKNLLNFFKLFFPETGIDYDIDYNSDEEFSVLLETIYNRISGEERICVKIKNEIFEESSLVYSTQDIYIDGNITYYWEIYQGYNTKDIYGNSLTDENTEFDFLTVIYLHSSDTIGHSEIRLHNYV